MQICGKSGSSSYQYFKLYFEWHWYMTVVAAGKIKKINPFGVVDGHSRYHRRINLGILCRSLKSITQAE